MARLRSRWGGWLAVLALTCGTGSGCAASAGGTGSQSASSGAPGGGTIRLVAADNGRTVTVSAGARIVLTLDNTYWHLAPVSSSALQAGKVAVRPTASGIPGSGRGAVVATYRAVAAGRAVVAANRTTCGEAMACSPDRSRYRVTVVVR